MKHAFAISKLYKKTDPGIRRSVCFDSSYSINIFNDITCTQSGSTKSRRHIPLGYIIRQHISTLMILRDFKYSRIKMIAMMM